MQDPLFKNYWKFRDGNSRALNPVWGPSNTAHPWSQPAVRFAGLCCRERACSRGTGSVPPDSSNKGSISLSWPWAQVPPSPTSSGPQGWENRRGWRSQVHWRWLMLSVQECQQGLSEVTSPSPAFKKIIRGYRVGWHEVKRDEGSGSGHLTFLSLLLGCALGPPLLDHLWLQVEEANHRFAIHLE